MKSVLEQVDACTDPVKRSKRAPMLQPNGKKVADQCYARLMGEIGEDEVAPEDTLTLSRVMTEKIKNIPPEPGKDSGQRKKAVGGKCFELLMAELFVRHKVVPFYRQARLRNVPLSKFDFLFFHPNRPVVFSTKLSLAERWRQAAFEGDSLKRVYRNAECYLVTAEKDDASKRNEDIEEGKSIGIDRCLVMGEIELIEKLTSLSTEDSGFTIGEAVHPIEGGLSYGVAD